MGESFFALNKSLFGWDFEHSLFHFEFWVVELVLLGAVGPVVAVPLLHHRAEDDPADEGDGEHAPDGPEDLDPEVFTVIYRRHRIRFTFFVQDLENEQKKQKN